MAVPHVLPESQVKIFKFYDNQAIHEAILVEGRLMRLAGVFSSDQKREAFDFAYELCQQYFTMITPSATVYRIWVDIRCRQDFRLSLPLPLTAPSPSAPRRASLAAGTPQRYSSGWGQVGVASAAIAPESSVSP
jgi:hypothetical protein